MKKIITCTLAAVVALALVNIALAFSPKTNPKKAGSQKAAALAIRDSVFNFGKIPNGKPVSTSFVFTNTTKKPIVITSVSTCCGCTTPEYDAKPLMAGKTTIVKIGYYAASVGSFYKSISVSYTGGTSNIYIQGEVIP